MWFFPWREDFSPLDFSHELKSHLCRCFTNESVFLILEIDITNPHTLRPEAQMLSFFLPFPSPTVSGPGTSPGESISHNYLESDRFSPSLFLPPPGVHAILLSSLDLCSRLLPGLAAEGRPILHLAAKTSLACMWKSSPIASLLKAPWLSTAHCLWDKNPCSHLTCWPCCCHSRPPTVLQPHLRMLALLSLAWNTLTFI